MNHHLKTFSKFPIIFKIVAAKILLQVWKQMIITWRKLHDIITISVGSLLTKFYEM
jgi:hypothetical protein